MTESTGSQGFNAEAKAFGTDVIRAATVDVVARAMTFMLLSGAVGLGLLVWQGGSVPAWLAVTAVVVVLAAAIAWGVRVGRRSTREAVELGDALGSAHWAIQRYEVYTDHVADVLNRLQRVLNGELEGVSIPDYIQRGIIEPARDVMQGPHEDIRLSVLLPVGDRWRMAWSAGHSLDGQRMYNERIVDTLSREPYESGEPMYWSDVTADDRFRGNPQASRPFCSMLSGPIRNGNEVIGVLNVISSVKGAFDPAEQRYVASLGSVIGVAVSVFFAEGPDPRAGSE